MPCEHGSYGLCPQCVREERDRLRAELADVRADRDRYSDLLDVSQGCVRELRRLLDEARRQEPVATLVWSDGGDDVVFEEFAHTFNGMKLYAAPVPAQPAVPDDVAKDAARYRFLRSDGRCDVYVFEHYLSRKELDAAIDAAIISATEGRSNG